MGIEAGQRFGSWTAVRESLERRNGHTAWICRCDCGRDGIITATRLKAGRSSGCPSCVMTEHGHKKKGQPTPEYSCWRNMLARCFNEKHESYKDYGRRGITVCLRWQGSGGFQRFIDDLGVRPDPRLELDRIDNEKGYEPGNVRWATRITQNRNTRASRLISIDGETLCLAAWSERYGIDRRTIGGRLRSGWSAKEAVMTPVTK